MSRVYEPLKPNCFCVGLAHNPRGFSLLNALIEDGYAVVIGDTRINKQQVEPSASPFSPVV